MINNLLPKEATHTTLYLFETYSLLISFDNVFTQKVRPSFSPGGAMLEFEVLGDSNTFIELQKLLLEIKCKISRNNDGDLRTGTNAANTDAPYLSNNALHSSFSERTVSANAVNNSKTSYRQEKLQKTLG